MSQAIIFHPNPRRPWLAARSARSLRAAGFERISVGPPDALEGSCLLLEAGRVLRNPAAWRPPPVPPGLRLMAAGLPAAGEWLEFHALHGGDYRSNGKFPAPVCEWHSCGQAASERLAGMPVSGSLRAVHWAPLDPAAADERLSVLQIVTSLQHGGAEKIARDLAAALPRHGVAARLVVLGRPHRRPLAAPPGVLDFSHLPRSGRAAHVAALAVALGADVLHVHLTDADETRALAASGIPLIATVHNTCAGWPRGWQELGKDEVRLMLACSRAVEDELREALPRLPVRTVWNGIDPREFPETPPPPRAGGIVLACIANPRPQKRLELLPAILAALVVEHAARGLTGPAPRLVIAGESSALAEAAASRAAVDREAEKHGVAGLISWTEGAVPICRVLAECHALVSCSAHEGLSLAHLEALSAGRPVIACDTGGTRELAWNNPAMRLLHADAGAHEFARALADALQDPPPSAHRWIWRDFTIDRMAERVARFARQAACHRDDADTLWFVCNNLSTGGAQSSLRRLLKSIRTAGRRVRLALIQEYPEHPSPGRLDLTEHGVEVFVPPPAGLIEPAEAVDQILAEMTAEPPAAVVFWNAITAHKMLLADALPFTPVHDVSPGEMWFSALDRCLGNPPPGLPCRSATDYGRLLDRVVVKYSAEAVRAAALGTGVAVIPNGVAVPAQALRRPRATGPLVFCTAARICPQKRLDELIDAFRLFLTFHPDAVLRIAGGAETGAETHAADLRGRAAGLPVEWLGNLGNLDAFHAGCDVFVMISDPAGCPNASLEALAAGVPVIATDVGGAAEQVIDGVTGRLVPARDVPALARAMVDLANDETRRTALGDAARDHIRRHFTLERMCDDYLALLGGRHAVS